MWTFEDYVEQSQKAPTIPGLKTLFERVLADEGYENYVMTTIAERSLGNVIWSEFPKGFLPAYFAAGWDKIDPLIPHALRARRPFLWRHVLVEHRLSRAQSVFMHDIREMGVHSGIVFPMHRSGPRRDVIDISMRQAGHQNPHRLGILQAVCTQTWSRYPSLLTGQRTTIPMHSG